MSAWREDAMVPIFRMCHELGKYFLPWSAILIREIYLPGLTLDLAPNRYSLNIG